MCDTFVVPPKSSKDHCWIFGKNSDREPNEAQSVVDIPAQEHAIGSILNCTYRSVPQARFTNRVILSKPFWMWGAEMGVNEQGVAIGNEAVFTKIPLNKENTGLTGMDMLRIALERSNSAENALDCILEHLHNFGQDACGGYQNRNFFYHNSFLIADAEKAFVLETAGKLWAIEYVKGARSISNGLSIGNNYNELAPDAIDFAKKKKWIKPHEEFNWSKAFSSSFMSWASSCKVRQIQSTSQAQQAHFDLHHGIDLLSSHHDDEDFRAHKATTKDICMHATGVLCPNQTVGSMLAFLKPRTNSSVWVTNTSNPCLSVFKPLYFYDKSELPLQPTQSADNSIWWQAEKLHRLLLSGKIEEPHFQHIIQDIAKTRDTIHHQAIGHDVLVKQGLMSPVSATRFAFQSYQNHLKDWLQWANQSPQKRLVYPPLYSFFWKKQGKSVGL
ncbi:peptidase U34 [Flectobacillus rivi]|uniref:Peptidase U34 n=1 Tax=Flectobacillus rivi TaxID=2984209 RepID=A0ABT6Z1W1_9BACT|nr:peptidase U34 [Flectobacillus rivi]MDI9875083.1 peptidase U34 [Flectobacillus rivi]